MKLIYFFLNRVILYGNLARWLDQFKPFYYFLLTPYIIKYNSQRYLVVNNELTWKAFMWNLFQINALAIIIMDVYGSFQGTSHKKKFKLSSLFTHKIAQICLTSFFSFLHVIRRFFIVLHVNNKSFFGKKSFEFS